MKRGGRQTVRCLTTSLPGTETPGERGGAPGEKGGAPGGRGGAAWRVRRE